MLASAIQHDRSQSLQLRVANHYNYTCVESACMAFIALVLVGAS